MVAYAAYMTFSLVKICMIIGNKVLNTIQTTEMFCWNSSPIKIFS